MKRSVLTTGVTVVQLLLGLGLAGSCAYLLLLARSSEMGQAGAAQGLEIAAGLIAPFGLLALAGAYGLWRNKLWSWWLALLVDLALVSLWVGSMIDDGWRDLDMTLVAFTLASLLPVVLLLVPGVRRFYWGKSGSQVPPPAATHV